MAKISRLLERRKVDFTIQADLADPDPGKNLHANPDPDPGGKGKK